MQNFALPRLSFVMHEVQHEDAVQMLLLPLVAPHLVIPFTEWQEWQKVAHHNLHPSTVVSFFFISLDLVEDSSTQCAIERLHSAAVFLMLFEFDLFHADALILYCSFAVLFPLSPATTSLILMTSRLVI
jgi:hypothetical protein